MSVKSFLPFLSLSRTSLGSSLTSSITSSVNTSFIPWSYIIDKISTPGSFLWPIILTTSPKYLYLPISFTILTWILCPSTKSSKSLLSKIISILNFLSSGMKWGLPSIILYSPTIKLFSFFNTFTTLPSVFLPFCPFSSSTTTKSLFKAPFMFLASI